MQCRGAYISSSIHALWKNSCNLEEKLLCSTAICAQEEISPRKDLCVRCWKPLYEPADPESHKATLCEESLWRHTATVAKKRCTHKHKHANVQINGKIHRNSLPKWEAEIMRAIVPIPSVFPVKSNFSLPQDSTESWKSRRSGKGHPYKRWRKGRVCSFYQFWKGDVGHVGMGEN